MIKGEKINLRLVTERDVDELFAHISNLSNRGEHFPHTLCSYTQFKKQYIESGFWTEEFGRFLIVDKDNKLVGSIYYFKAALYSDALELGYIIFDQSQKNLGYTTEALSLMVEHLFSTKNMNRIQLLIAPAHEASKKVALKAGFQFEGVRRQIIYMGGKHADLDGYVRLRNQ